MPGSKLHMPTSWKSLSARLLVLTVFFVMLSEVLIYAPSVGRYRVTYLRDRIADAHLATLALAAAPSNMVEADLRKELLDHARAYGVVTHVAGKPKRMLMLDMPPVIDATYDLRRGSFFVFIMDAFETMLQSRNRVLRVFSMSPKDPKVLIEIILDEAPMRTEMLDYSGRILILSLIISFFTACLVYLSLQWLLARPIRLITENMVSFSADPEDDKRMMPTSRRGDEIGVVQRELRSMQKGLGASLRQKTRLAALGSAVAKINHDLRNMLAAAQLVSDRLATSEDPDVKRVTPTLVSSIDRAVSLCTQTLDFARNERLEPKTATVALAPVVDDVIETLAPIVRDKKSTLVNEVATDLSVEADRDQLFRALVNLGTNAVQAGAGTVRISAEQQNGRILIDVADNGPGLPERKKSDLFRPFAATTRNGGSGLGLAIAREIMLAHGGDATLVKTSKTGTRFRLELPQ
ncbi:MAG: HAMP domain-containing sensor histidine kinase [Pseudomonadota bacterium]